MTKVCHVKQDVNVAVLVCHIKQYMNVMNSCHCV